MKSVAVLIMSCDKYEDLWQPFFKLFHKYWNCPYKIYISTETKECNYAISINHNEKYWTQRIKKTLQDIPENKVIIMCEDFFLKDYVDQKRIDYCINCFNEKTATYNFEKTYDDKDITTNIKDFKLRPQEAIYKLSSQAGIWDKEKLMELLDFDLDAWEWENKIIDSNYDFYINSGDYVFNYGYENHEWFGVRKGKWTKKAIEQLEEDGIDVDFSKRGVYEDIDNNSIS